jgi:precorrin-8X/cobalt-precorrin-8 methylmutase
MDYIVDPNEIDRNSIKIIDEFLVGHQYGEVEKNIVRRLIHTSGDPGILEQIVIHPQAALQGVEALARGAKIFTDVTMVQAGLRRPQLEELGIVTQCLVHDTSIAEEAKALGITRSMLALRKAGRALDGAVVAIGNAPTALFELIRLHQEEGITPAFVAGIPVGFVGAAESKEALLTCPGLPHVTVRGTKGGSPMAACVINVLLGAAVANKK